jgi:hypothetical protein
LVAGALYFNSGAVTPADKGMRVYDGAVWIPASAAQEAALVTYEFVATAGQTTFSGNDANGLPLTYIAGGVIVALNGVVLRPGDDFTATNGSSIVLASAAALNDELVAYAFASFDVANTYTQAQIDTALATKQNSLGYTPVNRAGDTMTGGLTLGGALNLGSTGQIVFPATQNASSDANTLDDYEEGTWTPLSGDGTTPITSVNKAVYIKIGKLVTIELDCTPNSPNPGNNFFITGLPFAGSSSGAGSGGGGVGYTFGAAAIGVHVTGATTSLYFQNVVTNGNFNVSGVRLIFSISYTTSN